MRRVALTHNVWCDGGPWESRVVGDGPEENASLDLCWEGRVFREDCHLVGIGGMLGDACKLASWIRKVKIPRRIEDAAVELKLVSIEVCLSLNIQHLDLLPSTISKVYVMRRSRNFGRRREKAYSIAFKGHCRLTHVICIDNAVVKE